MSGANATPLRVVEISSGIAGAYCGWLLQQLGAQVGRIGAPADFAAETTEPITLALGYYAAEKQTIAAGDAVDAIARADLVITDDAPRFTALVGR